MLKTLLESMNPASSENMFVAHLYNQYTSQISDELKAKIKNGIPQEISSKDIDNTDVKCKPQIEGWLPSIANNPNPDSFYTV